MERIVIDNKLVYVGHCPIPACEAKQFIGDTEAVVLTKIREHLTANLEDPIHSDISDTEGWFNPDPLGD